MLVKHTFLTREEIQRAVPEPPPTDGASGLERARKRMVATRQWSRTQSMGLRWPMGCVALEITQRCNLDCTACYLSEHSQAIRDLPLQEVFRRIDMIFEHYGPDTSVQVTGGDPTLRKRDELVAIVRRLHDKGLRPALFTNGIKASRSLLDELAEAGLEDVAFHVDMTQGRRGYASEAALNALRLDYIERARGLPLAVYFNTTVTGENFDQIPAVTAFFVKHSDVVQLASFQPLAETGRGVLAARPDRITTETVEQQIEQGSGTSLSFDTARAGHTRCNRYAMALVANGHAYDFLDNEDVYAEVLARAAHYRFDRRHPRHALATMAGCLLRNPDLLVRGAPWFVTKLWQMKADLFAAKGHATKISFFIHNFMDACHLERERIDGCIFMAATRDGPISMCLHNAKRDAFLLQPVKVGGSRNKGFWNPVSGAVTPSSPRIVKPPLTRKTARGRARRRLNSDR